jgi:ATP-dependent Clp protease protease subunit
MSGWVDQLPFSTPVDDRGLRPQFFPSRASVKRPPPAIRFQPHSREPSEPRDGWELLLVGDLSEKQNELTETLLDVAAGSRGTIYFDSNGGSAYVGITLAGLIRLRNLDVTAVVLGECSSASLLPFSACRKRYVLGCSTLYFHPVHWSSEEDVTLEEAAEWARHFKVLETDLDKILSKMFPIDYDELTRWTRPAGRFFTGAEFAETGLAKLIDLFDGDLASQIERLERE